jgi:aspartate 1-decarboxylase
LGQNNFSQYRFVFIHLESGAVPKIGHYLPTLQNILLLFAMMIQRFKSKIHRVKVTQADLNYVGSITIDEDLMEAAGLIEGEKVQVVNNNNGERLETYVIPGERGSGVICLNGAAARRAQVGDILIIIAYAWMDLGEAKNFKPQVVFPDEHNRLPLP